MCRPQDLTAEMARNFGVFQHVKVEDTNTAPPEKRPREEEEPTSDSDDSDKHHVESRESNEDAPKSKKRKIWRVMLSPHQALEIYNRRPPLKQLHGKCGYAHGSMRNARVVAQDYSVSAKTIRDIWNRYSWAKVTRQLWTEEEAKHYADTYTVRGHQGIAGITGRRGSDTGCGRTNSHEGLSIHGDGPRSLDAEVDRVLTNPLGSAALSAPCATKLPHIQTIESLVGPLGSIFKPNVDPKLILPVPAQLQTPPALQKLFGNAAALPLNLSLPPSGPTLQAQIDESKRRLQELISFNSRCMDQRLHVPLIPPLPLPHI